MKDNPFAETYKRLPDHEIISTIEQSGDYDPLAVAAAQYEFDLRKLTEEDVHLSEKYNTLKKSDAESVRGI